VDAPIDRPNLNEATIGWATTLAVGTVLFAFGVWICLERGRIGFMPLDQSIIFDGGWRVLSGQAPYRDFRTPNGLVPMVLEAAWFRVLGVTWLVHCLHAAVFNGLFCVLVYAACRLLGGAAWLAAIYGGLSGVVFYPPFGVAYADQHAFFFTFLYLLLGLAGTRSRSPWDLVAWGAAGPVAIAAALSKQIPSALGLPILLGLLLVSRRRRAGGVSASRTPGGTGSGA
jgi:hypothetical protein